MLPPPLVAHLERELGVWPPPAPLTVTTTAARAEAGWDGRVRAVMGVATPDGAVVSVSRELYPRARDASSVDELARALGGRVFSGIYRWTDRPAGFEPFGAWFATDDPVVPEWLRPFGGDVLLAVDEGGRYIAGVGLKHHDDHVWEISVGTEEAARGRGIARRLVVTAARAVIDTGRIPTYLHDPANHASAKVAEASGFEERGWRILGFSAAAAR